MNNKDACYLIVGAAILGLLVYVCMTETGVSAPRSEATLAWNSPLEDVPYAFASASQMVEGQSQVYTQHRYPAVSGTNISTLIHYGLSAMTNPHVNDLAWMYHPPAEYDL